MNDYFCNPICGGQDPFVCKGNDGFYYFVSESSDARSIELYRSERLSERGEKKVVFEAFRSGICSADLWAPEIWYLRGKWYIYFAGAEGAGQDYWDTHRMYVLEADEPFGPYRFVGQLDLGERMSIDATVMELPDSRLILFYMGRNDEKTENHLYMAPMDSPTHISGSPVCLSRPEYTWEADINEGPFPIVRDGHVYLMYSANAAHLSDYCIALLKCNDIENILKPSSWEKENRPILSSCGDLNGPGHACIVESPDGTEDWLVFHSKATRTEVLPGGWDRIVSLMRITWDENGRPCPVGCNTFGTPIRCPSGEPNNCVPRCVSLKLAEHQEDFSFYGYSRKTIAECDKDALCLHGEFLPEFGNKLMLRHAVFGDFVCRAVLEVKNGGTECGVLFRVSLPAVGRNRWHGYGLFYTGNGDLRLTRCNGREQTVLARKRLSVGKKEFRIEAVGDTLTVFADGEVRLTVHDDLYSAGRIGLYSPDGFGKYYELEVLPKEVGKL